ncbi:endoIII-related endonuclease [Phyllobacterium sp. YR531]|uniref:endonuclease III domain-containing protein n=1 Tax=Phyllobacterium sp. YR531 TaxID=1144343 RepID=UPI00026F8729|nr:endoIII-related endonuclease [Phyllobacterium sp. YR531]EJN04661.1 putative endoIII-related endonuclease [Phyllobacterium sp. YR531]
MQYVLDFGTPSPLVVIHDRLKAHYGIPSLGPRFTPVSMLVMAMLGSRTYDNVSLQAFQNLRAAFGSWEAVANASPERINDCIYKITFSQTYCVFIPEALSTIIKRYGSLNLDTLSGMTVEQALHFLQQLRGVGPKISACVLNFSTLHMRALVVDTHYLRFAARFQLIKSQKNYVKNIRVIQRLVPNSWLASDTEEHHVLVKQLAQEFCVAGTPRCARCPLSDLCNYATRIGA